MFHNIDFTPLNIEKFIRGVFDLDCGGKYNPPSHIIDKGDYFELTLNFAGYGKEDINIGLLNGQTLEIKCETTNKLKNKGYHFFDKRFKLCNNVDKDNITAEMKYGLLTIKIPKKNDSKAKTIKIE